MAGQNPHFTTSVNWSAIVKAMYPDILTTTHSVPPMYFNKVPYCRQIVPGTGLPALVLQEPLVAGAAMPTHDLTPDSLQPMPSPPGILWSVEPLGNRPRGPEGVLQTHVNDDTAQAQVLRNLQELGESRKEAMFIISQLNYNDYLHDPAYAPAVAQLPTVPQHPKTGKQLEGDFDILLIHRHCGILLGELKTVGKHPASRTDVIVTKTIQKALKQLDKSKDVMNYLVSDVVASPDRLTVRATLFLPFVSSVQLQRVLAANPQLEQAACSTLGATSAAEAAQLCCCEDQLSDPQNWWEVGPAVLSKLNAWWQARMHPRDPHLNDNLYLDVVARFVGPATSVAVHCSTGPRMQVKTPGQAVSALGGMLTTLVLTPDQVDLMQQSSQLPLVYLNGPPGTGKTVMLTLVGLRWLRQGEDVHVVSVWKGSKAASRLIKKQLETTLAADSTSPPGCGRVFLHDYDLFEEAEKDRAVSELAAFGPEINVIVDEVFGLGLDPSRHFPDLLTELSAQVSRLRLWAAGIQHNPAPPALTAFPLQTALRSAPAVVRQVEESRAGSFWSSEVHPYNNTRFPAAGDGLRVERLVHEDSGHNGHTGGRWCTRCYRCGQDVAAVLRRLGVGEPDGLSCRDVFIIAASTLLYVRQLEKDVTDDVNIPAADCDLVRAIRDAGLSVQVMAGYGADEEREAGLIAEGTDNVIVATDWQRVVGMERKVVVVLDVHQCDMLHAASRATAHLVIVTSPSSSSSFSSSVSDACLSDTDPDDLHHGDGGIPVDNTIQNSDNS